MREIRNVLKNVEVFNSSNDSDGNPNCISGTGLLIIKSAGVLHSNLCASEFVSERLVKRVLFGREGRINHQAVAEDVEAFVKENGLGANPKSRSLLNVLTKGPDGTPLTDRIQKAILSVQTDVRMIANRKNNPNLAKRIAAFAKNYGKTVEGYGDIIGRNARNFLERMKPAFESAVRKRAREEGINYGLAFANRVKEEWLITSAEFAPKQFNQAQEARKEYGNELSRVLQEIETIIGDWWNLFKNDAVQKVVNRSFPILDMQLQAELATITWPWVEKVYRGVYNSQGQREVEGLITFVESIVKLLAESRSRWMEVKDHAMRAYEDEKESRPASFEIVIGQKNKDSYKALFNTVLEEQGRDEEIIREVMNAMGNDPLELGKRSLVQETSDIIHCVRKPFTNEAKKTSVEEMLLNDKEALEAFKKENRQWARPWLKPRDDLLSQHGIDGTQQQCELFCVEDAETSKIKEILQKEDNSLRSENFISTGESNAIIVIKEMHGLPVWSLDAALTRYHQDYQAVMQNPSQKSLGCTDDWQLLPEISAPKIGIKEYCEDLLIEAIALGLIELVEKDGQWIYAYKPQDENKPRQVLGKSWFDAHSTLITDFRLRWDELHQRIEKLEKADTEKVKRQIMRFYLLGSAPVQIPDVNKETVYRLLHRKWRINENRMKRMSNRKNRCRSKAKNLLNNR